MAKKTAAKKAAQPQPQTATNQPAVNNTSMNLSATQKSIIERVLNAFETGSAEGDYANISIYRDGPHEVRQITYGRSQTTEYGKLDDLIERYVNANGTFSTALRPYVNMIGHVPLVDDGAFKTLLRRAGSEDPVMRSVQDTFFDDRYFKPALAWAVQFGFTEALSMLVIYDSFVHSGTILGFLRSRFPERPPASGGNERTWISQYVGVRHDWLANHERTILNGTVYRTNCFKREIARGNWSLSVTPINANGIPVSAAPGSFNVLVTGGAPVVAGQPGVTPFLGSPQSNAGNGPSIPGLQPALAAQPASSFVTALVRAAEEEWRFFGSQTYDQDGATDHSGHKEGEDGWWQQVGLYWEKIGRDDLDGRDHEWPWSAAFISYVMRRAGAGDRFRYSAAHATYIAKSIRDRNQANANASYWGYRLNERKPLVGDLICLDRDSDKVVDFDHQHQGDYKSHCDIIVAVHPSHIEVIGGNVGNSVTRRPIALNAQGYLPAASIGGEQLFAIMGCRLG